MKKFYKLDEIADFENINNFFAATGTPTYKTGAQELTLWNEAQFESVFEEQCEKSFYNKETLDPWGAFKNKYTQWLARNGNFIANELEALLEKYNPIYNYDRHEVYSGSDTETQTPTDWVGTTTETPDNWKQTTTQTPTNWKETETQTPTNWQDQNVKSYTDYHETETQTPTNWEKTETQTPTNWQKTSTDSFTNYKETETQTPNNWQKTSTDSFTNYKETETQTPTDWIEATTTEGGSGANGEATQNQIIPFNGTDWANVSKSATQREQNVQKEQSGTYQTEKAYSGTKSNTESQTGTFATEKAVTGTKANTESQTGTYQTVREQDGTYETDKVITGSETDTRTQSGTYTTETAHTGTFKTETEETGSRVETNEKSGTFETETSYGKKVEITGNIGVTTTAEMIEQVLRLYDTDFVYRWITRFIDSVCVYV